METERQTDRTASVGVIGAGHIQALASLAQRAGRKVVIANSRGPESLAPVVAALGTGVSAGTVADAAAAGIVAIAVPWTNVPAAVAGLPAAVRPPAAVTQPRAAPSGQMSHPATVRSTS